MNSSSQNSDVFLIEKLRNGDSKAFEELYLGRKQKLFNFVRHLTNNEEDANELVQDVFLKLWERKEYLKDVDSLDAYIFTIAKNKVYKRARKRAYEHIYTNYIMHYKKQQDNCTEDEIFYSDIKKLVDEVIESMPGTRKKIFKMSREDGMSNKQIAMQIQTSESNIENHINKAIKTLRAHIKDKLVSLIILLLNSPFLIG